MISVFEWIFSHEIIIPNIIQKIIQKKIHFKLYLGISLYKLSIVFFNKISLFFISKFRVFITCNDFFFLC